jgi:hypothetical protein
MIDKVFIVLASRYGYTKTLFGVYSDKLLADNRIIELKDGYMDLEVFEIEEITLNSEVEMDF